MVKSMKVVSAFVASPMDVAPEREALERVAKELNIIWGANFGIQLELIKWETHTRPGVGTDTQAVVNSQLADDFDVFIGILWSRIGSETPRARSGTVEEFQRAYDREKAAPGSVEILMYLKDGSIPPSQIDPIQLRDPNSFKERLKALGVLSHPFNTTNEFEALVRTHLAKVMGKVAKQTTQDMEQLISIRNVEDAADDEIQSGDVDLDDPDAGLLDFEDIFFKAADVLTKANTEVGTELSCLTNSLQGRAADLTVTNDVSVKKQVLQTVVADMTRLSATVERVLPTIKDSQQRASIAGARSFTLKKAAGTLSTDEVETILNSLDVLLSIYANTRQALAGLGQSVGQTPNVYAPLTRAKRRLERDLAALVDEYAAGERLFGAIKDALR